MITYYSSINNYIKSNESPIVRHSFPELYLLGKSGISPDFPSISQISPILLGNFNNITSGTLGFKEIENFKRFYDSTRVTVMEAHDHRNISLFCDFDRPTIEDYRHRSKFADMIHVFVCLLYSDSIAPIQFHT